MEQAATSLNTSTTLHPEFKRIRAQQIPSLNVVVEEYEHIKTGARHFHLAADNSENVFLVAFRTVPEDSTGVAHILEHTVLCGSENYPVRDPFFMMIRRSLNTFMNAFTSSDWTAYPFASQNRKDFNNLLDVYLDAVFFSRLDKLDFSQEGHRVEFEKPDDINSELVYKGVVFNEMKGAMSSPVSILWQTLTEHLFPTNTYHYNSGGEPENIPDLSYDELIAFYKTHYHPSNAIFMTFGDIPVYEHHERMHKQALSSFEKQDMTIQVDREKRYNAPQVVVDNYAIDEEEDATNKTHVVMGWLLGESTDLEGLLKAHLLSDILLENSSCPLRQALETTALGSSPSPLCGLEDSNREMTFMCGLEGSSENASEDVEALILSVLEEVATNGVEQSLVDAMLHQLELSQREVHGDGYPYGLHLILDSLSAAVHGGDPIALLDLEPVLEKLREEVKQPDFVQQLVSDLLLNNQHRVLLSMQPDKTLNKQRMQHEKQRLLAMRDAMNDTDKQAVVKLAADLQTRQAQQDDESILPKVGLEDIPDSIHLPDPQAAAIGESRATCFAQGTNGLVYQQMIMQLPALEDELIEVMPYYSHCLTELGCGDKDYLQAQAWQSSVSGGVHAYSTIRGSIEDVQNINAYFIMSGKSLVRNNTATAELMDTILQQPRFDELPRIRDLIAQTRARRVQSITGNGHQLAMMAATSRMSPAAQLSHRLRGLQGIAHVKALDETLSDEQAIAALAEKFAAIHSAIQSAPRDYLLISEAETQQQLLQELTSQWQAPQQQDTFTPFTLAPVREHVGQCWVTSTQVNFCAKSYATVPPQHEDAAALTVLGGVLRNGFLHTAIREQGGAYGGGASHDGDNAAFRFYSYRDPRLTETLDDFDRSIDWMLNETHEWRQVEESILGVISSIDKPGSPAGEAKDTFYNSLYGRTPEQRMAFRKRVLAVTLEDLQRVTGTYLKDQPHSTAVITQSANVEQLEGRGLEMFQLS